MLAADDEARFVPGGEALLRSAGVKRRVRAGRLGGRLTRLDGSVRAVRPVFGRDVSIGLGYGATSFAAAASVWLHGSAEQRQDTARLLLGGGRLTVAYEARPSHAKPPAPRTGPA